jgi:hypothetical protein
MRQLEAALNKLFGKTIKIPNGRSQRDYNPKPGENYVLENPEQGNDQDQDQNQQDQDQQDQDQQNDQEQEQNQENNDQNNDQNSNESEPEPDKSDEPKDESKDDSKDNKSEENSEDESKGESENKSEDKKEEPEDLEIDVSEPEKKDEPTKPEEEQAPTAVAESEGGSVNNELPDESEEPNCESMEDKLQKQQRTADSYQLIKALEKISMLYKGKKKIIGKSRMNKKKIIVDIAANTIWKIPERTFSLSKCKRVTILLDTSGSMESLFPVIQDFIKKLNNNGYQVILNYCPNGFVSKLGMEGKPVEDHRWQDASVPVWQNQRVINMVNSSIYTIIVGDYDGYKNWLELSRLVSGDKIPWYLLTLTARYPHVTKYPNDRFIPTYFSIDGLNTDLF